MRTKRVGRYLIGSLAIVVPGVAVGALLAERAGVPSSERPLLLASLVTLGLSLVPLALLSMGELVDSLRRLVDGKPGVAFLVATVLFCPYLGYWIVAADASPEILRLILMIGIATLVAVTVPRKGMADGGDLLLVLVIWLPIEFRLLRPAFPWPEGGGGSVLGLFLALDLLLFLMLAVRRFDPRFELFHLGWRDLSLAVGAFVAFAAVGIPLGLWSGFIGPGPGPSGPREVVLVVASIFLITGLPEEILFRGFIQNLFDRWFKSPYIALGAASLLFGVAHLNNGPTPDWRYFMLSTLAGLAYGYVFMRTRRVAPAAVTHTLVDATWSLVFNG